MSARWCWGGGVAMAQEKRPGGLQVLADVEEAGDGTWRWVVSLRTVIDGAVIRTAEGREKSKAVAMRRVRQSWRAIR